ncbi:tyrosine-protein phosphatase non-receptor type 23-like [Rhinichthys klamathensis goyatoka]|uniref:tyrosine-protein phosphatase non-receptor type 23-like n=1 Tax=Rhinichthys klamathensis goyatoka TaxID=3034132 RepID=UPI0024B56591|nr:tyrosine-protein phosphatase non-receptor type 23-like [Rhinichthys klamathensis goyatoka]
MALIKQESEDIKIEEVFSVKTEETEEQTDFKMTRRKFKPCPSCQAPNQVSRKTCSSCFTTISNKTKLMAKKVSLDREWGERILKNRNAGRVVDSANIAVKKLSALGYVPILFFGKKDKASGKWVADVVTHLPPTEDNLKIVATMRMAYNFVLIKQGNSTTTLPEPQHQGQPEPQHQHQGQPEPQPQHQGQPEPQHTHQGQPEPEPQHQHQGQPEPQHQHQGQPEPQHQHQGQPEPQPRHQGQPEPQHQGQPEPQHQHQGQPEPQHQHQGQPEPQPQHQGQPEPQHTHQGQPEPQPVSLPVKEQTSPQNKRKCK